MTRQEVIDAFKTELSKTYTITTTEFKNGQTIGVKETVYPNELLSFNRDIIEAALRLLEE